MRERLFRAEPAVHLIARRPVEYSQLKRLIGRRAGEQNRWPPTSALVVVSLEARMKYLCIAYEEEQKLNDLSKSEWLALRQETLDYVETLRKRGLLIITHALQSATTASTVRIRSGKLSVTDGPLQRARSNLAGSSSSRRAISMRRSRLPRSGLRLGSEASRYVQLRKS